MTRMLREFSGATLSVLALASILLAPLPASARNTEHFFSVQDARESSAGQNLFDIPFYMKGQKHPGVVKTIGTWESNRPSRGVFRSDESSCHTAFISAIRSLQQRAESEGGNAVIDIVSVTMNKKTESATQYRCIAGSTVVHVGLKGKVVKLAK